MSGTSAGLLDAHGYAYAGLQAVVFGMLLALAGNPWPMVFLTMAGVRALSMGMMAWVRA
jgi:hypothetical protein